MKCLDCFNFKMLKGWEFAHCVKGMLVRADDGQDKLYKVKGNTADNNLIYKAKNCSMLNPKKCMYFEGGK